MSKKVSAFKLWIDKEGTKKVAEILGVQRATVSHWRVGRCLPRTDQMKLIKKVSNGFVSYESIIDGN